MKFFRKPAGCSLLNLKRSEFRIAQNNVHNGKPTATKKKLSAAYKPLESFVFQCAIQKCKN
jgi:hypothetical protein